MEYSGLKDLIDVVCVLTRKDWNLVYKDEKKIIFEKDDDIEEILIELESLGIVNSIAMRELDLKRIVGLFKSDNHQEVAKHYIDLTAKHFFYINTNEDCSELKFTVSPFGGLCSFIEITAYNADEARIGFCFADEHQGKWMIE